MGNVTSAFSTIVYGRVGALDSRPGVKIGTLLNKQEVVQYHNLAIVTALKARF